MLASSSDVLWHTACMCDMRERLFCSESESDSDTDDVKELGESMAQTYVRMYVCVYVCMYVCMCVTHLCFGLAN